MSAQPDRSSRGINWVPLTVLATAVGFVLGALAVHFYQTRVEQPAEFGREEAEKKTAFDKVVALGRIEPRDGIATGGDSAQPG
jgi:hypothetical protein